ncbi:hypothetical protein GGE06_002142 [Streptomyces sp. SFB5A]|jgi:hypothetical protein|uniref:Uncharacterized protein n=1 Tax=Streptomyces nymphaeiformis TaxID=2663842 RepID=A0A7W7TXJ7_9ACTN|nr:hypothetical protein [Streptomyces nymphaeiformis]
MFPPWMPTDHVRALIALHKSGDTVHPVRNT